MSKLFQIFTKINVHLKILKFDLGVTHMGVAWSASMGLAHPSQAERMQALLFGSLHAGSLVWKRRCLVVRLNINHATRICQNK